MFPLMVPVYQALYNPSRDSKIVASTYAAFACLAIAIYNVLSDGLASLLTLGAGLQTLALVLLVLKVQGQASVSGISTRMLGLYAMTLALRLTSTLFVDGYLPADKTGDGVYQAMECFSLILALWLLRKVMYVRRVTFMGASQIAQDSMPGLPWMVLACLALAVVLHADLNRSHFYDTIWAGACYLETLATLPQLWMISQVGVEIESLTNHFVALTALARFCSLYFWFLVFGDTIGLIDGNYSEMAIIGAHLLQLVFSCDFLMLYVKSLGRHALAGSQWI